jgi:hypothetical protein
MYDKSLAISRSTGDRRGIFSALSNKGIALAKMGHIEEAAVALQESPSRIRAHKPGPSSDREGRD